MVTNTQAEVTQVAASTAVAEVEISDEQLKIDKQSIYK
jgi:hypothetical protein